MNTTNYLIKFYPPVLIKNDLSKEEEDKIYYEHSGKLGIKCSHLVGTSEMPDFLSKLHIPYTIEPYPDSIKTADDELPLKPVIEFTKLYYTVREVCDILKITKSRFDTMLSKDLIKTIKKHNKTYIEKEVMINLYNNFR
ncbi:MAG TPA: hypothetical protein PLE28_03615 [bacterium]|nr:hypothetical protein [bacterium]